MTTPPETQPDRRRSEFSVWQLLPNMMTIAAICAGLTAIRAAVAGNFQQAVVLVLAAALLDGLDGRVARMLRSASKMGAELDSLADFLNFGVAPALVVYFWTLQDSSRSGWIAVLVFSVCCVMRLARFNVDAKEETETPKGTHFVGVPSPAGAGLAMLPMYLSFATDDGIAFPHLVVSFYMGLVGLLMISRIPTPSFKGVKVSRENVKYLLVGVAFIGAAMLTYAWLTLVVLCAAYVLMLLWGLITSSRGKPAG